MAEFKRCDSRAGRATGSASGAGAPAPSPPPGSSAVFIVTGYGILAEAYLRLAGEPGGGEGAGAPAPEADPVA